MPEIDLEPGSYRDHDAEARAKERADNTVEQPRESLWGIISTLIAAAIVLPIGWWVQENWRDEFVGGLSYLFGLLN